MYQCYLLTYFSMRGTGVQFKWWWYDSEKMMLKKIDEKNDETKLDKGDCPTLRIIYI